jgi:hypothetical protein
MFVVANVLKTSALSNETRRALLTLSLAAVAEFTIISRLNPRIHIFWVWIIILVGAPFLRNEWKTLTAVAMLLALVMGTIATNLHHYLPGKERVEKFIKFMEWIGLEQRKLTRKQQIIMTLSGLAAYGAFYLSLVWHKMNTDEVSKAAISLFTVVPLVLLVQLRPFPNAVVVVAIWIALMYYCSHEVFPDYLYSDLESTLIACEAAMLHVAACMYTPE